MSPTQMHLMLNHLPLYGLLFVAVAVGAGFVARKGTLVRFGLAMLVAVALSAVVVLFTGEPAEETVEHLAGVSKSTIEAHERVARPATFVVAALGAVALVGLARSRRREPSRAFAGSILILALGSSALLAWTAHLGGVIRHPEIASGAAAASPADEEHHDGESHGGEAGRKP